MKKAEAEGTGIMIKRTWLILALTVITVMSLVTYAGVTQSFFSDNENSSDDRLGIRWGHYIINDGFENTGSPEWDDYWNENGTTTWVQDSSNPHSGIYNARITNLNTPGYLTSDELDSSAADNITVVFWFKANELEAGDCLIQLYNGITYTTWYDLVSYPGYVDNTWCKFAEVITDPQYLLAGFRIRFDASTLGSDSDEINIDDFFMDFIAPTPPSPLVATPGDEQIILDWDDNSEGDLTGYNIYRSTTSGSGYTKINPTLVTTSNYTDYPLWGGGTFYYVVTALDLASNESDHSNEDTTTANDVAPTVPVGLVTTPGDRQVSLDWNDNIEGDLEGYNIYRSMTSGSGYTKINGSLETSSNYLDTSVHGGYTYYYVVTASDLGTNESDYSIEDSVTPTSPTSIDDGFENSPWDFNWDENGVTDWTQNIGQSHSGSYSAIHSSGDTYLISDDIDNSASGGINVSFWFRIKQLNKGPIYVQLYNGTSYNNWYDLVSYPGVVKNTWIQFSHTITDAEYFRSDFRIRFDGSSLTTDAFIDDVIVIKDTIPPAAPANLVANPGDEQITLDWDDNSESDLAGYNVYRSTDSGGSPTPYTKINSSLVATSNYIDDELYGGGTYFYVVTAVDLANNEGPNSNEDIAAATDVVPAVPTGLVATATPGVEEITLEWDDNSESDLAGYNVYRSIDSGGSPTPYAKINGSLVATSHYADNTVMELVTYYYVVKAVDNGTNESAYSNEDNAAVADLAPAAPTNLVATAIPGVEEITLEWDDNSESDLAGYNVYRSTDTGGSPTPYTKINGTLMATSTYIDDEVYGGGTYYYVVKAVDNGVNESDYSNEDSATIDDVAPAAPTGLVATATPGVEETILEWDDNSESDLVGYNIYRSTDSGGSPAPYTKINGSLVVTSNYTDDTVTELVTYYYVVKAVDNGSNESDNSNEDSAAADLAPAAPANLV
ncbi:fibronectin type III domain-containing protein, partial [Chloroflexota bacterium]